MTTRDDGEFSKVSGWLTGWTPVDEVPDDIAEALPAALSAADAALQPADIRAFAVAIDGLVAWAERFGLVALPVDPAQRQRWVRDTVADYREALDDLPADLLAEAVKRVKATHKYRNLPLPADLRTAVGGELSARNIALMRLKTAAMKAGRQEKREVIDPDQRPRSAAFLGRLVGGVQRLNERRPDDAEARRDSLRVVQEESERRPLIAVPGGKGAR